MKIEGENTAFNEIKQEITIGCMQEHDKSF